MGDTYPTGPTPVFPPKRWVCDPAQDGCGKEHSKPHFEWPGQIDRTKKPGEEGRVVFNRIKDEKVDVHMPVNPDLVDKEAPMLDEKGHPKPLMCPHCGATQEGIVLIKTAKKRRRKLL
jgi:hypothetical protein